MTSSSNCAGGQHFGVKSRFWTDGVLVSFIGSLDQFDLSIILQRIESYKKTGLLVVKRGERFVELSFRQGQLMCIGPVRPDISLADRLLQAGVITGEAYQEAVQTLGANRFREVGAALSLIDLGHVNQQSLYGWALSQATCVIEALLAWTDGEIYFEDDQQPPAERLLIALPVSALLPERTAESPVRPTAVSVSATVAQQPPATSAGRTTGGGIENTPTMHGEEPAFVEDALNVTAVQPSLFPSLAGPVPSMEPHTDALAKAAPGTLLPPRPVRTLPAPAYVNAGYMQPQMVLTPVDLSAYREQNPLITFTPDQWRLFTRADGHTTLQAAMHELNMSREQVCQVAGELATLGIITVSLPGYGYVNELSPVAPRYIQPVLSSSMMAPGYPATPAQSWDATQASPYPSVRVMPPYPIETQSQWGNGGNGATFLLGNGWVVTPPNGQPSQPMRMNYRDESSRVYAQAS